MEVGQEARYGGTAEELKRDFTFRSAFGLAFVFISPIVALYAIYALTIESAGPSHIWAYVIGLGGQLLVAAVFAECASKWPFEGSVYQWSRRLIGETPAWWCGWAYMWCLLFSCATCGYISAGFIPVVLHTSAFSKQQQTFVALGILLLATLINTIGRRALKVMITLSVIAELVGSIGIGTALLFFHHAHPVSSIFHSMGGAFGGGPYVWSGLFAATAFVGWSFVGFESAGAISEEVHDAARAVPKAIVASLICVGVVVIYSATALTLATPDYSAVVAGKVADPVANTVAVQLGTGVQRPLFALIIIGFLATMLALQTSASRVLWSKSRDDVMIGSGWLKKLTSTDKLPTNSILTCGVLSALVIMLTESGKIYSTLVDFSSIGFYIAFAFPVVGAALARMRGTWVPGPFRLGPVVAPIVVGVAAVWCVFETLNLAYPRAFPGMAWYLQYGTLIAVGVVGVAGLLIWLSVRDKIAEQERLLEQEAPPLVLAHGPATANEPQG